MKNDPKTLSSAAEALTQKSMKQKKIVCTLSLVGILYLLYPTYQVYAPC
jgi:hypothetical protein